MTKQIPERIQRKIRALRAMANDASSENEAMIAGRQLFLLLAKYGIDEIDIKEEDRAEYDTDVMEYDHKTGTKWSGVIALGLANLYFCHLYQSTNGKVGAKMRRYYHLTGSDHYRHIARMMIEKVVGLVDLEARATVGLRPPGDDPWAYICSFRNAAAHRIATRCQLMAQEAKEGRLEDDNGNRLPVLVSLYDRELQYCMEFLSGKVSLTKGKRSSSKTTSSAGRSAGDSFGSQVGLRQEIGKASTRHLIGQ